MTQCSMRPVVATIAIFLVLGIRAHGDDLPPPLTAREILEGSAVAYQGHSALADTLTLTVEIPSAPPSERIIHYAFGTETASVEIEHLLGFVVDREALRFYRVGVDGLYFEQPIGSDLASSLAKVRGPLKMAGLLEPPQLGLRSGVTERALDSLRITTHMKPLTLGDVRRLSDGRLELSLAASNGGMRVRWSPSLLLDSLDASFRAEGAPEGYAVRLSGRFCPVPLDGYQPVSSFSVGSRRAVERPTQLEEPAPGVTRPPESLLPPDVLKEGLRTIDQHARAVSDVSVLLIGETHRVRETIDYATALLERLDDRPLRLLLELPARSQSLLDRYMSGDDEALDELFSMDVLPLRRLVVWAREHRDRVRRVIAIDEDQLKIDLQRDLTFDTRNDTMAGHIAREYRSHPDDRTVAYCGQLHMTMAGRYRFDEPSREPAGSRLSRLGVPRNEVASIIMDGAGRFPLSAAWRQPGAIHATGQVAKVPFAYFIDYPIFGVTEAGELFDWFVNLGTLTRVEE